MASPERTPVPELDQALIVDLRKHVRTLLVDLANEDLGSALLDLSELRRILSEISPEQQAGLGLD
jgi:hypothetical protein